MKNTHKKNNLNFQPQLNKTKRPNKKFKAELSRNVKKNAEFIRKKYKSVKNVEEKLNKVGERPKRKNTNRNYDGKVYGEWMKLFKSDDDKKPPTKSKGQREKASTSTPVAVETKESSTKLNGHAKDKTSKIRENNSYKNKYKKLKKAAANWHVEEVAATEPEEEPSDSEADEYVEKYFVGPEKVPETQHGQLVKFYEMSDISNSEDDDEYEMEVEEEESESEDSDFGVDYVDFQEEFSDEDSEESYYDDDYDFDLTNYDTDDDEDYVCEDDHDMVRVPKGEAKVYDASTLSVSFENGDDAQIIELPNDELIDSDTESCPQLVPIEENQTSDDFQPNIDDCSNEKTLMEHIHMESKRKNNTVESLDSKSKIYSSISGSILLHLRENVFVHGRFSMSAIFGSVESFGYRVGSKSVKLYSPSVHSLLYLKPINDSSTGKLKLPDNITTEFWKEDLVKIVNEFDSEHDALLWLCPIEDTLVDKMTKHSVYPDPKRMSSSRPYYAAEVRLSSFLYMENSEKEIHKLTIDEKWNDIELEAKQITMVVGINGSGKSTLVRYLINSHLSKFKEILLIDFDIGQSEVGLPQTVSAHIIKAPLLGPGFLNNDHEPIKTLLFGDNTPSYDIVNYVRVCRNLLKWLETEKRVENMPWVINTMGYDKGLASEILLLLIRASKIDQLVQLVSKRCRDEFPPGIFDPKAPLPRFILFGQEAQELFAGDFCLPNYKFVELQSLVRDERKKSFASPSSITNLRLYRFLDDILKFNVASNFNEIRPIVAPLNAFEVRFRSKSIPAAQCPDLLDGCLIYLSTMFDDQSNVDVIGIAIVRTINVEKNEIHLITNVVDENFDRINILAVTKLNLEKEFYEFQHFDDEDDGEVPYLAWTDDFIGSRKVVHQSYRPDTTPHSRN